MVTRPAALVLCIATAVIALDSAAGFVLPCVLTQVVNAPTGAPSTGTTACSISFRASIQQTGLISWRPRSAKTWIMSADRSETGKFFKMGGAEDTQRFGPRSATRYHTTACSSVISQENGTCLHHLLAGDCVY